VSAAGLVIRAAGREDRDLVFAFIRELAEYEKLLDQVDATPDDIARALFSAQPRVFCDIAAFDGVPSGWKISSTSSLSTSLRACSIALGGL